MVTDEARPLARAASMWSYTVVLVVEFDGAVSAEWARKISSMVAGGDSRQPWEACTPSAWGAVGGVWGEAVSGVCSGE